MFYYKLIKKFIFFKNITIEGKSPLLKLIYKKKSKIFNENKYLKKA